MTNITSKPIPKGRAAKIKKGTAMKRMKAMKNSDKKGMLARVSKKKSNDY